MNVYETGIAVLLAIQCVGAVLLGNLSRQVSLLQLAIQIQGAAISKLQKEEINED